MKNNKIKIIICLIVLVILLSMIMYVIPYISKTVNENKIKNTINEYFNTLKLGNYDESLRYLDKDYDYSNNYLGIYFDELVDFYSKFTIEINTIDIKDNYSITTLKLKNPKITYLIDENFNLKFRDKNYDTNYYKTILNSDSLEYEEGNVQLNLKKVNNEWKIINDICFKTLLTSGVNKKTINFDEILKNENSDKETSEYIDDFVSIVDYKIGYDDLNRLSLYNIEIKNNGDKDIAKLEIEVILPNNIKRTITLFDGNSSKLKGGYSWKSTENRKYDLERMSKNTFSNINKDNIQLKIKCISFASLTK